MIVIPVYYSQEWCILPRYLTKKPLDAKSRSSQKTTEKILFSKLQWSSEKVVAIFPKSPEFLLEYFTVKSLRSSKENQDQENQDEFSP